MEKMRSSCYPPTLHLSMYSSSTTLVFISMQIGSQQAASKLFKPKFLHLNITIPCPCTLASCNTELHKQLTKISLSSCVQ